MKKSDLSLVGLLLFAALVMTSCSSSRKKNKCNTCPKWEDRIEVTR